MKQPRELTDGNYIETNLSSVQKERELKRFIDRLDFDVHFEGDW